MLNYLDVHLSRLWCRSTGWPVRSKATRSRANFPCSTVAESTTLVDIHAILHAFVQASHGWAHSNHAPGPHRGRIAVVLYFQVRRLELAQYPIHSLRVLADPLILVCSRSRLGASHCHDQSLCAVKLSLKVLPGMALIFRARHLTPGSALASSGAGHSTVVGRRYVGNWCEVGIGRIATAKEGGFLARANGSSLS